MSLQRYDIGTDQMVDVTQKWVDAMQQYIVAFGFARQAARKCLYSSENGIVQIRPEIQAFLDSWHPDMEKDL